MRTLFRFPLLAVLSFVSLQASAQTRVEVEQRLAAAEHDFAEAFTAHNQAEAALTSATAAYAQAAGDRAGWAALLNIASNLESGANEEVSYASDAYQAADGAYEAAQSYLSDLEWQVESLQSQIDWAYADADDLYYEADDMEWEALSLYDAAWEEYYNDPCGYTYLDMLGQADLLMDQSAALYYQAGVAYATASSLESYLAAAEAGIGIAVNEVNEAHAALQAAASDLSYITSIRDQAHTLVENYEARYAEAQARCSEAWSEFMSLTMSEALLDALLASLFNEMEWCLDWLADNP